MSKQRWYLIKTKAQKEEVAKANLENQHYCVYLPHSKYNKRAGGKYTAVTRPTFPGYIFIQLDTENDNWRSIHSTRGVSTIVRFGNALPLALPSDLIPWLQNKEQEAMEEDVTSENGLPTFKIGDKLNILEGPFKGYEAIFACNKANDRVKVLLEIANSFTELELSGHQVGYE